MAWSPRHRAPIVIFDPAEDEILPDYDAIVLQGGIRGGMLEIGLLLEGEVQADIRYIVNVVVRSAGSSENPHIYRLTYLAGIEEDYGIPASQDQNSILLDFPFSLLAPDDYVVGLEAVIQGPDVWDIVNEMPREDLELVRLLALPFDAALLIPAVLGLAALGSWWLLKAMHQRKT